MPYAVSTGSRWGCLLSGIGVIVVVLIGAAFITGHLPVRLFNTDGWKQVERSDDYARLRMVEHLMASGRLDGLTRAQVIAMLGPPDDTNYFSEWDMVYWLGPERSLASLDPEWLVIRFGPSGTVGDYRVVSD
jgi:hypothetical protein